MFKLLNLFIFLLFSSVTFAASFYLDPLNGSLEGDGSISDPWPSLNEVVAANLIQTQAYSPLPYEVGVSTLMDKNLGAPVQSGDTLLLLDGDHGYVEIDQHYNHDYITLMAAEGHSPLLTRLHFRSCRKWNVVGLEISSESVGYFNSHLLFVESHNWRGPCSDFMIKNCEIYAGKNAEEWSIEEWQSRTTNGINVNGDNIQVVDNVLTNINFGIQLVGNYNSVIGNTIKNFSGDGIRPLGRDILVENNVIKNCYAINDNHDDGIQSFNLNGEDYSNVVIRGNTIINFEDPDQPLRGPLQGIGCFDGPYNGWIVENNVISVDHWHGITFLGAYDCIIQYNTVVDPTPDETPGSSWIRVADHKDGTPSSGCVVANNVTNSLVIDAIESSNVLLADYQDYDEFFADYSTHNYRLKMDCSAVDAADSSYTIGTDINGLERPQGAGYDIGAYEYEVSNSSSDQSIIEVISYPNPFTDIVTIDVDRTQSLMDVEVYDIHGQPVQNVSILKSESKVEIDGSSLSVGMYLVHAGKDVIKVVKI